MTTTTLSRGPATLQVGLERGVVDGPYGWIGALPADCGVEDGVALLRAAVRTLRRGFSGPILGPLQRTTFGAYRLNLGPFGRPPFPLEPWNPPHHLVAWQRAGFRRVESYATHLVPDTAPFRRAVEDGAGGRDPRFRILRLGSAPTAVQIEGLYRVTLEAFHDARWFTPLPFPSFCAFLEQARLHVPRHELWIAVDGDGALAGYQLGYPYGLPRREIWCSKTLAVRPRYQRRGLCRRLLDHAWHQAWREHRIGRAAICLVHDGNPSARLAGEDRRVVRRYGLYRFAEDSP